ncbi:MAG: hypothetical protein ACREVL_00995, partial [Solimonas sp.]
AQHRIVRLAADGRLRGGFGRFGLRGDGFNYPSAVLRAGDGTLLVADTGNRRIGRYSAQGAHLGTLAQFDFMPKRMALAGTTLAVHDAIGARLHYVRVDGGAAQGTARLPAGIGLGLVSAAGPRQFVASI